ncbi:MAG: hypothetical protein HKO76_02610, partial [Acidimicrobiia bacterium]|nr:hypothetical protein [Acidimicrobiia bacterium]
MITVTLLDNPFERSNRIIETVSRPGGADIAALVSDEYEYVEVNGVRVGERHYVEDGDYVVAMRMPGGSGFDPVTFLLYMAASVAISYGINAIMPPPEGPTERDAEKSPTYGFSRMKNIRGENQPIPVIYGEHRVAGTIVNESVEVFNATGESTYRALVVVSEGPIYSIAGQTINTPATDPLTSTDELLNAKIFLNGNALSNFHGVNAWVRLGTLDQEYVPGFEKAKRTYDVNVFLSQEEGTVATWSISDYNETSDEIEARWDEYGFGWDVPDQGVDGVDVIVNFPQGLYRLVSNNANSTPWVLGLRFCALDGNGNPLLGPGQGGNQDDGWVRLPFEAFDLRHQGAFQLSFPTSFYNPLDHTGALPGDSLKMDPGHLSWLSPACYFSTTNDLSSTFRPSDWNDSDVVEGFTFETWIKFDTTDGAGGFSTDNTPFDSAQSGYLSLLEWSSDGDGNGVWYGFKIEDGEWYPHMKVGKWLRTVTWPAVNMPANEWVHVVWSHKRNSSSENSNKFWKNGQIKGNISRNLDIIVPKGPVAPIHFGRRTTGGSDQILNEDWYVRGEWDETLVLARASNQDYVNQRYNGGAGQRQTSSGNPDIVVGYHFDNSYVDLGIYQNDATPVGASGYSFVDEGGVVAVTTAPERTRGRYRIQAMRINYESSEDDDGERRRMDEAEWQLAVTWLDEAFTYPSAAYYGIEVPATEQLNTSAPNITAVCQGRMVRIWDGLSTTSPTFTKEWSQSP